MRTNQILALFLGIASAAQAVTVAEMFRADAGCLVSSGVIADLHRALFPQAARRNLYLLDRKARGELLGPRWELTTHTQDGFLGDTVAFQVRGNRLDIYSTYKDLGLTTPPQVPHLTARAFHLEHDDLGYVIEKESRASGLKVVHEDAPETLTFYNTHSRGPTGVQFATRALKDCLRAAAQRLEAAPVP